jgi:putative membrane protein
MHRRSALSLITFSAFIPRLALAQQGGPGDAALGQHAATYIQSTLQLGGLALATSRVAQKKASNQWVKRFADYEVAEQEGVVAVFSQLMKQQPPERVDEQRQAVDRLNGLPAERFDITFLQDQAEGHQKLLGVQENFIRVGQGTVLGDIASLIRGRVQEHIDLIQVIRDQMHQTATR